MEANHENHTRDASRSTGSMNRFVVAKLWYASRRGAMAGRHAHVDTDD
jgi:hypothetical protein